MHLSPAAVVFASGLALLAARPALAETLRVPSEDYPTIQSAVNASSEGDTILVAEGDYDSSFVVAERSRLRIKGLPGATVLSSQVSIVDCDRVTIEGLRFVDESDTGFAVVASGTTRLVLKNLVIEGYDGEGISLSHCTGPRVTGCVVKDGPGLGLGDVDSTDLVVEKCSFTNLGGLAVDLSTEEGNGSDRARLSRNTIVSGSGGIAAEGEDLRVEGNTVTLESGDGIVLGAATEGPGASVRKNAVVTSGFPFRAIDVRGSGATVSKNTATGPVGVGLFVLGDGSRIEGNAATGAVQGFNLVRSDLLVAGNVATSALDIGFIIQQGQNSTITRNRVIENGVEHANGFSISQPGSVISKNFVAEGSYVAFSPYFSPMTFTANVSEGALFADFLTSESESAYVLSRNRFEIVTFNYVPPDPL
jgi:nitrous oxidase accessory protein NosD